MNKRSILNCPFLEYIGYDEKTSTLAIWQKDDEVTLYTAEKVVYDRICNYEGIWLEMSVKDFDSDMMAGACCTKRVSECEVPNMCRTYNQLKHGSVTYNGSWVSYKTDSYSREMQTHKKFLDELCNFLNGKKIKFSKKEASISYASNSNSRKYCATISVPTPKYDEIAGNILPWEGDSIN